MCILTEKLLEHLHPSQRLRLVTENRQLFFGGGRGEECMAIAIGLREAIAPIQITKRGCPHTVCTGHVFLPSDYDMKR